MSDLVERLLGVYRVRDSATLSVEATPDNENYFVQTFRTTPIKVEAAREIERLRAENDINRAHAVEHYGWLVEEREKTARLRKENEALRGKVGRLERLNEYHHKRAEFAGRHVLALREALKPFAERCADVESYIAEYPADHPASNPDVWFTGLAWGDLLRARALYEGKIK